MLLDKGNKLKEVEKIGETYFIDCPECGYSIQEVAINEMPWNDDYEDDYECPRCHTSFSVKAEYEFKGFMYKL